MALAAEDLEQVARVIVTPMVSAFREGFDRLDARLLETNQRLDILTGRVDVLTEHVDVLTGRVDVLTEHVDVLTGRLDVLTEHVDVLTAETRLLQKRVDQVVENTGSHWRDHEERLRRLETFVIVKKNGSGGSNGSEGGN